MIRPMTCLSLIAALGAGMYLYQEKHRAQMLDRDITHTVKLADQARDRIGMLRAEWALLNEPERLADLAAHHLQLQPLQPSQFVRLEDLASRLPAPSSAQVNQPAMEEPVASAQPASALAQPLVASAKPPLNPASVPAPAPLAVAAADAPPKPAAVRPAAKPPAPPHVLVAAKPREPEPAASAQAQAQPPAQAPRPFFAPVMPAYSPAPVVIHAPTVQTASAAESAPFVGSALGMPRSYLAAPVPVSSGYTNAR